MLKPLSLLRKTRGLKPSVMPPSFSQTVGEDCRSPLRLTPCNTPNWFTLTVDPKGEGAAGKYFRGWREVGFTQPVKLDSDRGGGLGEAGWAD
jgi:hypothetical protein